MMKNTEWGAVAYLQHSEYGSHTSVRFNNNSDYKTGYASVNEPTCGETEDNKDCNKYGNTTDITQPYNTRVGNLASTTGNISGVYDMSGGAWEYMMSVMIDQNENFISGNTISDNSGFEGVLGSGGSLTAGYSWPSYHYMDRYSYEINHFNFQKRILGDSTSEMGPFQSGVGMKNEALNSWYSSNAIFISNTWPWFVRGGAHYRGIESGIFAFGYNKGGAATATFRLVLTP